MVEGVIVLVLNCKAYVTDMIKSLVIQCGLWIPEEDLALIVSIPSLPWKLLVAAVVMFSVGWGGSWLPQARCTVGTHTLGKSKVICAVVSLVLVIIWSNINKCFYGTEICYGRP